jgi:adenylylsulfate kinase-like enzyme/SAM-dependent methyltransferase
MGRVYWITGLPGSGKTTIGTKLYYAVKKNDQPIVLLDGNIVKRIFGQEEIDYTRKGREKRAFQYAELCKLLAEQRVTVICCTVAMFDSVRKWNRANIPGYFEIFIDVAPDTLASRDAKNFYKISEGGKQTLIGMDGSFEFPKNPDMTIRNTFNFDTDAYVEAILAQIENKETTNNQSGKFWNAYYMGNKAAEHPSDFAVFARNHMTPGNKIIDLGCGNGRDSVFFCQEGFKVTAIDSSEQAIKRINEKNLPIFAVCDDFVMAKALFCVDYNYCYARWSVHAISHAQQEELIRNVYDALQSGGYFFLEARTVNDVRYGLGTSLGQDEYFYEGHYRRFVRPEVLADQLRSAGFSVIRLEESDTFSVVGDDRPTLVRITAEKN